MGRHAAPSQRTERHCVNSSTAASRVRAVGLMAVSILIWVVAGFFSESSAEWLSDPGRGFVAMAVQALVLVVIAATLSRLVLKKRDGVAPLWLQLLLAYVGLALSRVVILVMYSQFNPGYSAVASANPASFVIAGAPHPVFNAAAVAGISQTIVALLAVAATDWALLRLERRPTGQRDGT